MGTTFRFPWRKEKKQQVPQPAANILYAPVKGNVIPRKEIPDEAFSSGVFGEGFGIEPAAGEVVSPFDGEIVIIDEARHAITLKAAGGMEVLIHVGIDTANMKGEGFEILVKEGQRVTLGQQIMTFDIRKIRAAGYSATTAVMLTNSDQYPCLRILKTGPARVLEKVILIE
jgi:PTS system sucrose-specific IIC component